MKEEQGKKKKQKVVFVNKEPTRIETIKNWIFIIVSVSSIFTFANYYFRLLNFEIKIEYKITALEEDVQLGLISDSVLNRNIAEVKGVCPTQKIDVDQFVIQAKEEFKKELEKQNLGSKLNKDNIY